MSHESKLARLAGLLYLIVVIAGVFRLVYVPSHILVSDDMHATINRIAASELLFRAGIASALVEQVAFLLLPLALFYLLQSVSKPIAVLMTAFVAVSVPIALAGLGHQLDVLDLLSDVRKQPFAPGQLELLVKQSFDAYDNQLRITELFWGLWLLPFGYLVFKSGLLPRILGIFLMLGCFSYVVEVFGSILFAQYSSTAIAHYIRMPAAVGEIGTCFWLLLFGARRRAGAKL
ncbi:DUF4386 domain-containing protein [Dyella sp. GSA-30]|uniref:DUF4386 domain-containing protein n=1 Tax=Dyella sp. GSA-30 TaxID=2994496 RepID=UPI00249140F7|nr:DUF4386 domain-containing protein [Dyella sp. GSA-30]BDU20005.1 hypothetical protein DYGSA30_14620 [Dyella sp. GSA-30]